MHGVEPMPDDNDFSDAPTSGPFCHFPHHLGNCGKGRCVCGHTCDEHIGEECTVDGCACDDFRDAPPDTTGAEPISPATCGVPLDCGGSCFLPAGHPPPCLCIGDEDGVPDTCPA